MYCSNNLLLFNSCFISIGITESLDYLKELGVEATWLSPIFKSPMYDFGYDIADFYDIQDEYGTMEDFNRLIAKANELGTRMTKFFNCKFFQSYFIPGPK